MTGSLTATVSAEKLPMGPDRLRDHADAIVVARIRHIRIEQEPARYDRAPGNLDWGIYLTLDVESVEKGVVSNERIVARGFRMGQRRWRAETIAPSGHRPIPEKGTRVRVHLESDANRWRIVLPNGVTPLEGNGQDARVLSQLTGRSYTHGLPGELWVIFTAVGVPRVP